ncbi:MAG: hypothetical protein H0W89_04270 [Candidatus Levybacteria bacterium]|nr:hypothetical protein [Candidatus Levybacteria bacterium]
MIHTTISKNTVTIRLTDERWRHIILLHPNLVEKQQEVLKAVNNPDWILKGSADELLAVVIALNTKYLVVVYKESNNDGFIITAYITTDVKWLFKKEIIWNKDS